MNLYFLNCEPADREHFEAKLSRYNLRFLDSVDDLPADAEAVSIFIQTQISAGFLAAHPRLRFVASRSTTYDHIDLEACRRAKVIVSFVPSYGKYTVAEHTLALILALARRLRQAMEAHRSMVFSYESLRGMRLRGKTLGVIGAGRIGLRVLDLARGFGMRRLACDLSPRPRLAARIGFQYVRFRELLERSDVISLHASLTPLTYHMLNDDTFAQCRRGVMVINTARGALIDSMALLRALDAGIVGGAGLDVLEDERVLRHEFSKIVSNQILRRLHDPLAEREPRAQQPDRIRELTALIHNEDLLSRPNVVFTPHIGFNSVEAVESINRTTVANIEAFLQGRAVNVVTDAIKRARGSVDHEGKPWAGEGSLGV